MKRYLTAIVLVLLLAAPAAALDVGRIYGKWRADITWDDWVGPGKGSYGPVYFEVGPDRSKQQLKLEGDGKGTYLYLPRITTDTDWSDSLGNGTDYHVWLKLSGLSLEMSYLSSSPGLVWDDWLNMTFEFSSNYNSATLSGAYRDYENDYWCWLNGNAQRASY